MTKKTTVSIAHSGADLGEPAEYTREQLDLVKGMIRQVADQSMGGMGNIVNAGDKVLIKINTVIPVPANAGFTTDPRMLGALIHGHSLIIRGQGRVLVGGEVSAVREGTPVLFPQGVVHMLHNTGTEER
jgi:uncharacterized protein (DUF362 family)